MEDYDLCAAFREHGHEQAADVRLEDVASIEASWTCGSDEPSFAWLLKLNDGRYAAASGGHDYTGWDCQSHFNISVHPTRDEAIRFGLTQNDRDNLKLNLPEDVDSGPFVYLLRMPDGTLRGKTGGKRGTDKPTPFVAEGNANSAVRRANESYHWDPETRRYRPRLESERFTVVKFKLVEVTE
jgi:hypothetical protein